MSKEFVDALTQENNFTLTENEMDAYRSTLSGIVDYFGTAGALRTRTESEIIEKFKLAFHEDNLLALKTLFYARNVRGGLGERKTPRIIFKWLADFYPEYLKINLKLIPEVGRWDDLFVLFGTKLHDDVVEMIKEQLQQDLANAANGRKISLLAKWIGKEQSESNTIIRNAFRATPKVFRTWLSYLRNHLDVVERKMSAKEWERINYPAVPSKAMNNYRKAFHRHDEDRFEEYLEDVSTGKVKINASTLYPYDIIEKYGGLGGYASIGISLRGDYDKVLEQQWRALPNYIEGENSALIMADTSGSMSGRPMNTSIGLATYFAERNTGPFKNKFMTFSEDPLFVTLVGNTLKEKLNNIPSIVANTNIEKGLQLILDTAVNHNLSNTDLPKALIIISDMEFDSIHDYSITDKERALLIPTMEKRFKAKGYTLPKIIFWNVNSRNDTFHALANDEGVYLVSGHSPSAFKNLLVHTSGSILEHIKSTLDVAPYTYIRLPE